MESLEVVAQEAVEGDARLRRSNPKLKVTRHPKHSLTNSLSLVSVGAELTVVLSGGHLPDPLQVLDLRAWDGDDSLLVIAALPSKSTLGDTKLYATKTRARSGSQTGVGQQELCGVGRLKDALARVSRAARPPARTAS